MRISDWSSDVCSSDLSKVRLLMAGRARREIGMRRMPLDNDDEPGPVTDNEISSFFASLDLSYSDVTELATRWFFRQRTVNLSAPLSADGSADTEASVSGIGRASWRERGCQ